MYQIKNLFKTAEKDVYKHGCILDSCLHFEIDVSFKNNTIKGLIQEVAEFLGIDADKIKDSIELNSCDEKGRVDFSVMEDSDSNYADAEDIKAWKQGNLTLWSCIYSARIEKIEVVEAIF